jgi:hypothetical protein
VKVLSYHVIPAGAVTSTMLRNNMAATTGACALVCCLRCTTVGARVLQLASAPHTAWRLLQASNQPTNQPTNGAHLVFAHACTQRSPAPSPWP